MGGQIESEAAQAERALQHAQTVSRRACEILHGCVSLWVSVEANLKRVLDKDLNAAFAELAAGDPSMKARFEHRHTECKKLWSSLKRTSRDYSQAQARAAESLLRAEKGKKKPKLIVPLAGT